MVVVPCFVLHVVYVVFCFSDVGAVRFRVHIQCCVLLVCCVFQCCRQIPFLWGSCYVLSVYVVTVFQMFCFSVVYFSVVVRFLAQRLPHLPRDHTDNLSTYLLSLMSNPELSFTFFSCYFYFYFYFWFEVYDMNFVQSLHRIWF